MLNQGGGNIMLSKTTNPRWTAPEVIRDSQIGPAGGVNRELWGFVDQPSRGSRGSVGVRPIVHTGQTFTIASAPLSPTVPHYVHTVLSTPCRRVLFRDHHVGDADVAAAVRGDDVGAGEGGGLSWGPLGDLQVRGGVCEGRCVRGTCR